MWLSLHELTPRLYLYHVGTRSTLAPIPRWHPYHVGTHSTFVPVYHVGTRTAQPSTDKETNGSAVGEYEGDTSIVWAQKHTARTHLDTCRIIVRVCLCCFFI